MSTKKIEVKLTISVLSAGFIFKKEKCYEAGELEPATIEQMVGTEARVLTHALQRQLNEEIVRRATAE